MSLSTQIHLLCHNSIMKGSVGPAWQRSGCGNMSPLEESGAVPVPKYLISDWCVVKQIIVFETRKIESPSVIVTC